MIIKNLGLSEVFLGSGGLPPDWRQAGFSIFPYFVFDAQRGRLFFRVCRFFFLIGYQVNAARINLIQWGVLRHPPLGALCFVTWFFKISKMPKNRTVKPKNYY